jgi:Glycerol kinase
MIRVKIFILDMTKILTIDQGTTSSRSIVFDSNANIVEVSQKEYPLIYPEDGWVEIDPEVLIKSVTDTLGKVNLDGIASAAITNQRETTIIWERDTGKPIYNAIVGKTEEPKIFVLLLMTKKY